MQPILNLIPRTPLAGALAALLGLAGTAAASPIDADTAAEIPERRAHGVHIHGKATVNLAVEDDRLLIELDSPTINLFGFEHPPRTAAQRAAIAGARELLADGARLFQPNPEAGCVLTASAVRLTLDEDNHDHGHSHGDDDHDHGHRHGDDDHDHGHTHGDDNHDHGHTHGDDDHDHGHTHGDDEHHADAHVDYRFDCAEPTRLTSVEVGFFEVFPLTERLRAQVIGPQGQQGLMLTPQQTRIDL